MEKFTLFEVLFCFLIIVRLLLILFKKKRVKKDFFLCVYLHISNCCSITFYSRNDSFILKYNLSTSIGLSVPE